MKKKIFLLPLSFFLIGANLFDETNIFGYWLTPGAIVNIENCDGYICAKIETIFVEEGVDPKQILDDQNKDESLRSRPLVGINILYNFLIEDVNQKTFKGGEIYDPRRGNTYKSSFYLSDDGCLLFVCDTEDWRPLDVTINEDGTKNAVLREINVPIKSRE